MVPSHSFLRQIYSCMFTVLPANFYDKVKEGSLILKKSHNFSFCQNGLIVDGEATPVATDIVIFGTGYKSDAKLKNISGSTYFQKFVFGSSAPLYRYLVYPSFKI